jgi:hypothetical protein
MQSDVFLAKDKPTSLFVHGVTEAGAAQLVVQDNVWLTAMVGSQPSVDGLCASLAAILRCLPSVMQALVQHFQACHREQPLEAFAHHESQPAGRDDDPSAMLSERFNKRLSCRGVEQTRPEFRRRIGCDDVVPTKLARTVQDYYVVEI